MILQFLGQDHWEADGVIKEEEVGGWSGMNERMSSVLGVKDS